MAPDHQLEGLVTLRNQESYQVGGLFVGVGLVYLGQGQWNLHLLLNDCQIWTMCTSYTPASALITPSSNILPIAPTSTSTHSFSYSWYCRGNWCICHHWKHLLVISCMTLALLLVEDEVDLVLTIVFLK